MLIKKQMKYWKEGKMINNKQKNKIDELRKQIDSEDTPEWKKKQAESKLAMFLRKVAPHKIWDEKGTYRKQGDK